MKKFLIGSLALAGLLVALGTEAQADSAKRADRQAKRMKNQERLRSAELSEQDVAVLLANFQPGSDRRDGPRGPSQDRSPQRAPDRPGSESRGPEPRGVGPGFGRPPRGGTNLMGTLERILQEKQREQEERELAEALQSLLNKARPCSTGCEYVKPSCPPLPCATPCPVPCR